MLKANVRRLTRSLNTGDLLTPFSLRARAAAAQPGVVWPGAAPGLGWAQVPAGPSGRRGGAVPGRARRGGGRRSAEAAARSFAYRLDRLSRLPRSPGREERPRLRPLARVRAPDTPLAVKIQLFSQ